MNPGKVKLAQLQYFLDVMETGSFTKAAEKNFTSQSNVSYAMKELERMLGVPLFIRRNNELTMTRYAVSYLPYVQEVFSALEKGSNMLAQMINPGSGKVNLAISYIFSLSFLPNLLRWISHESNARGTKIDVEPYMIHVNKDFHYVEEVILDGTCDLGLTCVRVRDEISSVQVGMVEHMLLLPRSHPLASAKKLSLKDVIGSPFVMLNGDSEETGNYYRNLFDAQGLTPHYIREGSDWLSLLTEVSAGKCLTVIPRCDVSSYDVAMVEMDHPLRMRPLYLAWPTNRKLSPASLFVKKLILEYLEQNDNSPYIVSSVPQAKSTGKECCFGPDEVK